MGAYGALCNLASLLYLQGQREEAMRLGRQALEQCQATFGPQFPFAAMIHFVLGRGYYEANQLIKAQSHLVSALELSLEFRDNSSAAATLIAYAIYAQLQQASKRYNQALKTLQKAKQLAQLRPNMPFVRLMSAIEAKVHLRQGLRRNLALHAFGEI